MSNVNNWHYANMLTDFETKVIAPQRKRVDDAQAIMDKSDYPWKNDEQKKLAEEKLKSFKYWLQFYLEFYKEGLNLVNQHENLVNKMSKWYDSWYENISNEGKQETELMNSQAEMLHGIFEDIYQELKPLNLEIKPPAALNLK